jgi:hypothetical protein
VGGFGLEDFGVRVLGVGTFGKREVREGGGFVGRGEDFVASAAVVGGLVWWGLHVLG